MHATGEMLTEGCDDAGIVILTGRPKVGVTDWQIWEGGAPNHATARLSPSLLFLFFWVDRKRWNCVFAFTCLKVVLQIV